MLSTFLKEIQNFTEICRKQSRNNRPETGTIFLLEGDLGGFFRGLDGGAHLLLPRLPRGREALRELVRDALGCPKRALRSSEGDRGGRGSPCQPTQLPKELVSLANICIKLGTLPLSILKMLNNHAY